MLWFKHSSLEPWKKRTHPCHELLCLGGTKGKNGLRLGLLALGIPFPDWLLTMCYGLDMPSHPPSSSIQKYTPIWLCNLGDILATIEYKDLARGGHWEFFSMVPSCHTLLPVYQEVKNLPLPHIHTAVVLCPAPQHMELNDLYLNPQAEINPSFLPSPRCFCQEFHCNDKDRNRNFGGQRWKGWKWSLE